jgi:hypothetical protein
MDSFGSEQVVALHDSMVIIFSRYNIPILLPAGILQNVLKINRELSGMVAVMGQFYMRKRINWLLYPL